MARASSLNCLFSCRNPYRTPHSLSCLPPFNCPFFSPRRLLGGRSGYFYFFFCLGRGMGEFEAPEGEGGIGFQLKIPRGEGVSRRGRGQEGVCCELGNFGGGGLNIFFSGPKRPPEKCFVAPPSQNRLKLRDLLDVHP